MRRVFQWHDKITIAGNYVAMALLFVICFAFCYEVAARYLFNAPTTWANALVSYLLCASIFLSAPDLTRRNEHVTINLLRDALPYSVRKPFAAALRTVAACMCLFAAWFCANETLAQYLNDIETILEWQIPKWIVSIFIPYGFLSSGFYFLRHMFSPPAEAGEGALA